MDKTDIKQIKKYFENFVHCEDYLEFANFSVESIEESHNGFVVGCLGFANFYTSLGEKIAEMDAVFDVRIKEGKVDSAYIISKKFCGLPEVC